MTQQLGERLQTGELVALGDNRAYEVGILGPGRGVCLTRLVQLVPPEPRGSPILSFTHTCALSISSAPDSPSPPLPAHTPERSHQLSRPRRTVRLQLAARLELLCDHRVGIAASTPKVRCHRRRRGGRRPDRGALCVSTGKLKVREGSDHEHFFLGPHTGPLKIVSVSGNVVAFRSRPGIGHFNCNVLRFLPRVGTRTRCPARREAPLGHGGFVLGIDSYGCGTVSCPYPVEQGTTGARARRAG